MSSRTAKARELIHNQNIVEVLNLWNNEDDINTISTKTGLSTRDIDMILITHEATKMLKGIKTKPEFVCFPEVLLDKNEIVAVVKKIVNSNTYVNPFDAYRVSPFDTTPTISRNRQPPTGELTSNVEIIVRSGKSVVLENITFDEVLKKLNLELSDDKQ